MGYRDALLTQYGYETRYENQLKYRGSSLVPICKARKDGNTYFPVRDSSGHLRRLASVQNSIPHIARIAYVVEDVVLFEEACGRLLWEMDELPGLDMVASALLTFAKATASVSIINGDVRPWNVFVDEVGGVQVIDWGLSSFTDTLTLDHHLLVGHYRSFHPNVPVASITDIDRIDVERLVRLMKGETSYRDEWTGDPPSHFPKWCRNKEISL